MYNYTIKFLLLFTCLLAFSCPIFADPVDDYIQATMQAKNIPGISVVVIKNGQVVKAKGYGLANVELNVPATPQSVYQLGSVAKQFTAALILLLAREGRLSLDDPINKYIKNTPASWKNITIRHLLTHTSGIKEYTATKAGGPSEVNLRLDYTDEQLIEKFIQYPLDFEPGEKFQYSDTGYVLLGIIAKKITGKHYSELLNTYIFKPLNMKDTRVISEQDIIPNRVAGYWLVKDELKNQEYVSPSLNTLADGSMYSTIIDMAKWDMALNKGTILTREEINLMWQPAKLNDGKLASSINKDNTISYYGLGWFIKRVNNDYIIEHGGWWQGFTAIYKKYINHDTTIIIMTNLAGAPVNKISQYIAEYYNRPEGKNIRAVSNCVFQFHPTTNSGYSWTATLIYPDTDSCLSAP